MARLLAKTLSSGGYVSMMVFKLEPLEEAILPPYTGRVSKSILAKLPCLQPMWSLYNNRIKFRPVTVTPLLDARGRPLYKRGEGGRPLVARPGRSLRMAVSAVTREPLLLACPGDTVDLGYARFRVEPEEARVVSLEALGRDGYNVVTVRILTPMTITSKIMMPPIPPGSRLAKRLAGAREMYRLLPTPGVMLAQALRQWLGIVEGRVADTMLHYMLGRVADILAVEVDHRLRPETVLYSKDEGGKARMVRGVVGYISMEVLDEGFKWTVSRLLDLASYTGLGKSRSMGFGMISLDYR